jgi:alpha-glucosidase
VASRIGPEQARVAAMLLLTLRGTPTIYQGEEIGMSDVPIPHNRVQDPWERNVPGLGLGRDPERTPMQWDGSPQAGFSSTEPWLPISDDHEQHNVKAETADSRSMLSLYKALIGLRRREPSLSVGAHLRTRSEGLVLRYRRYYDERRLDVALNFGGDECELPFGDDSPRTVLLSTHLDRNGEDFGERLRLRPNEGVVIGNA